MFQPQNLSYISLNTKHILLTLHMTEKNNVNISQDSRIQTLDFSNKKHERLSVERKIKTNYTCGDKSEYVFVDIRVSWDSTVTRYSVENQGLLRRSNRIPFWNHIYERSGAHPTSFPETDSDVLLSFGVLLQNPTIGVYCVSQFSHVIIDQPPVI